MREFMCILGKFIRMTPSAVLLCLMCMFFCNEISADTIDFGKKIVHQERGFISADVGGSVTLLCSYDGDAARYHWYKQSLGQNLKPISISYKYDQSGMFYDEFKDNPRFILETETGKSQLKISDLNLSDAGTYFCASGVLFAFEFGEGVTLSVQHLILGGKALVHQSDSKTVRLGTIVNLSCIVQTGSCSGELKVHWFKNSAGSDPGLIYTHEGRDGQCVRNPNTHTHTCVYELPFKSLNKSHFGTYYCAVVSCGRIAFGTGTQVDLETEAASLALVYSLTAAFTFTAILSVLLVFILVKMNNRDSDQTTEFKVRLSGHRATNTEGYENTNCLHYGASRVNQSDNARRRRTSIETECVYFCIKK